MTFKARPRTTAPATLGSPVDADTQRKLLAVAEAAERGTGVGGADRKPLPANQPMSAPAISALKFPGDLAFLQIGGTYHVPIQLLRENRFNSRQVFSASDHEEMCASLLADGQLEDCIGYVESSTVVLHSGHRRLRGAKQVGLETLRVRIESAPENGIAAYLQSNKYNVGHKPQSDLDKALSYLNLINTKQVAGSKELAQVLQQDEAGVSRLLGIARLPEQIISLVSDAPSMLTSTVLYEIHLLNKDVGLEKTLIALANCRNTPLSQRELQRIRKQLIEPPKPKPRSVRHAIAFGGGTGESKQFEEEGRFELILTGLSKDELKDVAAHVRKFTTAVTEPGGE